jgi:hypothetical protein
MVPQYFTENSPVHGLDPPPTLQWLDGQLSSAAFASDRADGATNACTSRHLEARARGPRADTYPVRRQASLPGSAIRSSVPRCAAASAVSVTRIDAR